MALILIKGKATLDWQCYRAAMNFSIYTHSLRMYVSEVPGRQQHSILPNSLVLWGEMMGQTVGYLSEVQVSDLCLSHACSIVCPAISSAMQCAGAVQGVVSVTFRLLLIPVSACGLFWSTLVHFGLLWINIRLRRIASSARSLAFFELPRARILSGLRLIDGLFAIRPNSSASTGGVRGGASEVYCRRRLPSVCGPV